MAKRKKKFKSIHDPRTIYKVGDMVRIKKRGVKHNGVEVLSYSPTLKKMLKKHFYVLTISNIQELDGTTYYEMEEEKLTKWIEDAIEDLFEPELITSRFDILDL